MRNNSLAGLLPALFVLIFPWHSNWSLGLLNFLTFLHWRCALMKVIGSSIVIPNERSAAIVSSYKYQFQPQHCPTLTCP